MVQTVTFAYLIYWRVSCLLYKSDVLTLWDVTRWLEAIKIVWTCRINWKHASIALLSQKGRAMLRVIEYFAKSPKVIWNDIIIPYWVCPSIETINMPRFNCFNLHHLLILHRTKHFTACALWGLSPLSPWLGFANLIHFGISGFSDF